VGWGGGPGEGPEGVLYVSVVMLSLACNIRKELLPAAVCWQRVCMHIYAGQGAGEPQWWWWWW